MSTDNISTDNLQGIWKYQSFFPEINPKYRLSLNEGGTTLKNINGVYYKCEYENPSGSVKDRSMAYQISKIFQDGVKKAVISSSGNAGISASAYSKLANIELVVFFSAKINEKKLKILSSYGYKLIETATPLRDALTFSKLKNCYNLRQSKDEYAVYGYSTIAYELQEVEPLIDAVFVPVSSGTTLVGIYNGYQKFGRIPAFHIVQTEKVHPVAKYFDQDFQSTNQSLADGIVAKYTPRTKEIIKIIKISKGSGWIVSEEEIMKAADYLLQNGLNCSYEGAMAYAGYQKAKKKGFIYNKPLCLLTGKKY